MGFGHIASAHAGRMNIFYQEHFNPYLNFHRPCGVPEMKTDERGKTKRIYKWYATPLEILRQLPGIARYLRDDLMLDELARRAGLRSDTGAAVGMQEAKRRLFATFEGKKIA